MTRRIPCLLSAVVPILCIGCHISDYPTITDNNQIRGGKFAGVQPVVDTRGKAHIQETSQLVTIWPDGTDETINFVDQKADGTATITTYNNFSTGSEPTFHDDLYCDTDRQGCAVWTSPDNNDRNIFDGVLNSSCSGRRSLELLVAVGSRYYGECGRIPGGRGTKIPLQSKIALFNSGMFVNRLGRQGLLFRLTPSSLDVRLTNQAGETFTLPIRGSSGLWVSSQDNLGTLDLRSSLFASTMSWYAEFLDSHATEATTATLTYNGISMEFTLAGKHPLVNGDTVRALRNSAY